MTGDVVRIPLSEIAPAPKVRAELIDLDHVALMVPVLDALPAIPVWTRADGIGFVAGDGNHRIAAHKRAGRDEIRAVVMGEISPDSEAEMIEFATVCNRAHGKPMAMSELQAVARRLIATTDWSNMRIAKSCGLSDKTVESLRPCPPSESPNLDAHRPGVENATPGRPPVTGLDGKKYPNSATAAAANRERVRHLSVAKPDASAREIAKEAGVSPTTAAAVIADTKAKLLGHPSASSDRPPLAVVTTTTTETTVSEVVTMAPTPGQWSKSTGFDITNAARDLARFLDRRLLRDDEDVAVLADGCPAAQRDAVAMVARDVARQWALLADRLSQPVTLRGAR